MKGPMGLVIAVALGLFAAILNWMYLEQKAGDFETVSFLGIAPRQEVEPGQALQKQDFCEVRIPKQHAGELGEFVYLWRDLSTVVGISATRPYRAGDLVFRKDYRTPPPDLELKENERLIWIPVDSRSFVPNLVDPGDQITFILPSGSVMAPTPAGPNDQNTPRLDRDMFFGPFTVGSLGSRLGSSDVVSGSRMAQAQERQIGIVVIWEGDRLEAKAMRLLSRLQQGDYRNISVALHPSSRDER